MTVKELFIVTKEFSIQNGIVPSGAIISIESIDNSTNTCTVFIKPFLLKGEHKTNNFTLNKDFIISHSSKIK